MKVSLISAVKDEESSIQAFLNSLPFQSKPPDEIVIVDGGSTDRTVEYINSFVSQGAPIKLIIDEGANIARSRNIAIENAQYDYIACTDCGCRPDKEWLRNLLKPMEEDPSIDIVSGIYLAHAENPLQELQGKVILIRLKETERLTLVPSSRSIAFKKQCWKEVGGYPEWLDRGEDTLFDLNLAEAGFKFALAKDAVVYWSPRPDLWGLYFQYYQYAQWEKRGDIASANPTYMVRYLTYILRSGLSLSYRRRRPIYLFYAPLVVLAQFMGHTMGRLRGKTKGRAKPHDDENTSH